MDRLAVLEHERERLERENACLREMLRLANLKRYGPRNEALNSDQLELLKLEPSVAPAEVETEAALPEGAKREATAMRSRKGRHPGRTELPAHLPRVEQEVLFEEQERCCPQCGERRVPMGFETSEHLDCEPAKYFVRVLRREKLAPCRCESCVPMTAPVPGARIVEKGKLSDAIVVDLLVNKYANHLPLYRQALILRREAGIELSQATVGGIVMRVGDLMCALSGAMREELLAGDYIQGDETPVKVQCMPGSKRTHQSWMFEYSRPCGPVVFDFRMGRGRDGPQEFLDGWVGTLQSDGYAVYSHLGNGITHAACLAHARRKFHEAHQVAKEDPRPLEVLEVIAKIYTVEAHAREQGMDWAERLALRQAESRPQMEKLRELIERLAAQVLPQSATGKACKYALGLWPRLERFLEDGQVELDNNWCENAMRPLALGRKNWMFLGSAAAGPRTAAIVSVFETCRRLDVNVREYLLDVLPRLADWPAQRVGELTPSAWLAARKASG